MPVDLAFVLVAAMSAVSAAAAMFFRNPVHCALSLVVTFAALGAAYLRLRAEFVGLGQILVYAGAVAILIMFAILLTRGAEPDLSSPVLSPSWGIGLGAAAALFGCLSWAVMHSEAGLAKGGEAAPLAPVRAIGEQLLEAYVLPLEVMGLLLTAAVVGAVLIAMKES